MVRKAKIESQRFFSNGTSKYVGPAVVSPKVDINSDLLEEKIFVGNLHKGIRFFFLNKPLLFFYDNGSYMARKVNPFSFIEEDYQVVLGKNNVKDILLSYGATLDSSIQKNNFKPILNNLDHGELVLITSPYDKCTFLGYIQSPNRDYNKGGKKISLKNTLLIIDENSKNPGTYVYWNDFQFQQNGLNLAKLRNFNLDFEPDFNIYSGIENIKNILGEKVKDNYSFKPILEAIVEIEQGRIK
jgi:hypothetical protein